VQPVHTHQTVIAFRQSLGLYLLYSLSHFSQLVLFKGKIMDQQIDKAYTIAVATNIARTWAEKYGYVPASEQPEIATKHKMFQRYGYDITRVENEQTQSV
jgi:hypothetical protein